MYITPNLDPEWRYDICVFDKVTSTFQVQIIMMIYLLCIYYMLVYEKTHLPIYNILVAGIWTLLKKIFYTCVRSRHVLHFCLNHYTKWIIPSSSFQFYFFFLLVVKNIKNNLSQQKVFRSNFSNISKGPNPYLNNQINIYEPFDAE